MNMNNFNKPKRIRPLTIKERILEHIWIVFPMGILAVVNYKYEPSVIKTFYDTYLARSPECQNGIYPS